MISFTVPGVPIAQPRTKATTIGGYARVYTPKTADAYKASVALAFAQAYSGPPLTGPVGVEIMFIMPRPKSMLWKKRPMPSEWHTEKPDVDNLAKAGLDSLAGLAWVDDSQVVTLSLTKRIASGNEAPCTAVTIWHVDPIDTSPKRVEETRGVK